MGGRGAWAALAALIAVSAGLRAWAGSRVAVPWVAVDETIYAKLGESLYEHGKLRLLGASIGLYTIVYPALAGIPFWIGGIENGYAALKIAQAALMSLAAVPAYLWARSLVSGRAALAAAALTLAPTELARSGMLMTEVAFYPLVVLAAWSCARALEEPTRDRQALAVALIAVACATRLQAIVLLPALLTAAALFALVERRRDALRRLVPAWTALGGLAVVWIAWRAVSGQPLLGAYQAAADPSYDVVDGAVDVVRHAGDLVLLTALVPIAGASLLVVEVLRRREPSRAVRAYAAVATSFSAWIVLQVGVFASKHVGYVAERNLFSLAPLVFVGFAAWLGRGAARPRLAASLVALAALGLVLTIPLENFLADAALPFSFTAAAFSRLLGGSSREVQELVIFGGAALAAASFVLVPRRAVFVLPVLAVAVLAVESVAASRALEEASRTQQVRFLGPDKRWIDRAGAGPSFYLYDGDRDSDGVWETLFWNTSITHVYDLPGTTVIGPLPQTEVGLRLDGTLLLDGRPLAARAAVVSTQFTMVGTAVAATQQMLPGQTGLRLWRLDPPARVSTRQEHFHPNGDVYAGETAQVLVFGCSRGALRLTLLVKQPQRVAIRVDGRTVRRLRFANEGVWSGSIPVSPGHGGDDTCVYELAPTGLLGTSLVEFERS